MAIGSPRAIPPRKATLDVLRPSTYEAGRALLEKTYDKKQGTGSVWLEPDSVVISRGSRPGQVNYAATLDTSAFDVGDIQIDWTRSFVKGTLDLARQAVHETSRSYVYPQAASLEKP